MGYKKAPQAMRSSKKFVSKKRSPLFGVTRIRINAIREGAKVMQAKKTTSNLRRKALITNKYSDHIKVARKMASNKRKYGRSY